MKLSSYESESMEQTIKAYTYALVRISAKLEREEAKVKIATKALKQIHELDSSESAHNLAKVTLGMMKDVDQ